MSLPTKGNKLKGLLITMYCTVTALCMEVQGAGKEDKEPQGRPKAAAFHIISEEIASSPPPPYDEYEETTPAGNIMAFAGAVAPQGWLLCDGQECTSREYPKLWQVLKMKYVPAEKEMRILRFNADEDNEYKLFCVPDLKGRAVAEQVSNYIISIGTLNALSRINPQIQILEIELVTLRSQLEAAKSESLKHARDAETARLTAQASLEDIKKQLEATQAQLADSQGGAATLKLQLEFTNKKNSQLKAAKSESLKHARDAETARLTAQASLEDLRKQLKTTQTQLANSQGNAAALKLQLEVTDKKNSQLEAVKSESLKQARNAETARLTVQASLENLKKQLEATQVQLADSKHQLEAANQKISQLETTDTQPKALRQQRDGESKQVLALVREPTIPIPPVAQGYEAIYQRFLKGVLVYRPQGRSEAERIDLSIATLTNPLEGTFDLSQCDDTSKFLSISTGYRKTSRPKNANKIEIWIAPRFLIQQELATTAGHFRGIEDMWASDADIGILWSWSGGNDLNSYDYMAGENMENLSKNKYWAQGLCPTVLTALSHKNLRHVTKNFNLFF